MEACCPRNELRGIVTVPKAVVFDFDGVLIDSADAYLQVLSETVAPVERDQWPRLYGMTTAEAVDFAAGGTLPEARVESLSVEVDRQVGLLLARKPPARAGAERFVRALRAAGCAAAVASSASRFAIDGTLFALGWQDLFAAVVGREDAPRAKPFPDVYLEAVRRLRVEPSQAMAIEDTTIGLLAAQRAGLRTIALGGTQTAAELTTADYYCADFGAVADLPMFRPVLKPGR